MNCLTLHELEMSQQLWFAVGVFTTISGGIILLALISAISYLMDVCDGN